MPLSTSRWGSRSTQPPARSTGPTTAGTRSRSPCSTTQTAGGDLMITGTTVSLPWGVAIDSALGKIYWGNFGTNTLDFANLNGTGGGPFPTAGASQLEPIGGIHRPHRGQALLGQISQAASIASPTLTAAVAASSFIPRRRRTEPAMPALLESPAGAGTPTITGGAGAPTTLSCSQGSWGGDFVDSLMYHAPQSFSYSWTLNGSTIAGANTSTISATSGGNYKCRVTATNFAGSTTQNSAGLQVATSSDDVRERFGDWRDGDADSDLPRRHGSNVLRAGACHRARAQEGQKNRRSHRAQTQGRWQENGGGGHARQQLIQPCRRSSGRAPSHAEQGRQATARAIKQPPRRRSASWVRHGAAHAHLPIPPDPCQPFPPDVARRLPDGRQLHDSELTHNHPDTQRLHRADRVQRWRVPLLATQRKVARELTVSLRRSANTTCGPARESNSPSPRPTT